jgi:hypothetical protein
MKVGELKGYKSLKALNAFHALMLGLKMLPAYMAEQYEDFFSKVEQMNQLDQEKMIRHAVQFVELQPDEVDALVSFCQDKNGVPYGKENIKNLTAGELVEIVVAVCLEIAKIKIDFVTESEKKKSETSRLISEGPFLNIPIYPLQN